MAELGAISQYALAIQQMQMSLIKNSLDLQQQAVEVLLDNSRSVPQSDTVGCNLDISI